ncbi:MAG: HAD family hydrolase [Alphaproteobacteria bacterium]|nr:HAD family hydrolase [Alphaproteobacteria bacterium]
MGKLERVKAVFWDWDGTLVDSYAFLHKTHNHVREKFSMPAFSVTEFGNYFGKPREVLYRDIYGADNIDEAKGYFETFVLAHHDEIQPMVGAARLLGVFADTGLPMGIVTNKKGVLVRKEITNHGWEKFFVCPTVGAGEAAADKPSPAPLLLALEKSGLNIEPSDVLFVGDTENDVLCAHAAGAQIAFIEEDLSKHAIAKEYKASLMFRNCDEFSDYLLQSA